MAMTRLPIRPTRFSPYAFQNERADAVQALSSGKPLPAPEPQAYRDISADNRKGLRSLFAYGKRAVEKDAYHQAHLSVRGIPGVVRLAVMDTNNNPIPYAPFE